MPYRTAIIVFIVIFDPVCVEAIHYFAMSTQSFSSATGAKMIDGWSVGFIRDEMAKQKQPFQAPYQFLWTGKVAEIGQRSETQLVSTSSGRWCILSGIVTRVGELPTFDQWVTTSSMAPPPHACGCNPVDPYASLRPDTIMRFGDCPYPDCTMCLLRRGAPELSLETLMQRSLEEFGTLQNQRITVHAYLNFDFYHRQRELPFQAARIYKVIHKCDDSKNSVWCVESIQDVTDLPTSELPQVFKDWEIGRANSDIAPYDLSDLDRKIWYLYKDVKWTRAIHEDEQKVAKLAKEHEDDPDFYAEEHRSYSGNPAKSALLLFALHSFPAIMTTPTVFTFKIDDDSMPPEELKQLLRQCVSSFEALSDKDKAQWKEKETQDLERANREREEEGGDY